MTKVAPVRGEIWMADFHPVRGHEQGGKRPGLIISTDLFNHGPAQLVIIVPLTTKHKKIISHVEIGPPEGGVTKRSFAKCEDIRSISTERLDKRLGTVSHRTLTLVEDRLRILMEL